MTHEEIMEICTNLWNGFSEETKQIITEIVLEENQPYSRQIQPEIPSRTETYWKELLELIQSQNKHLKRSSEHMETITKKLEKMAGKM